MFGFLGELRGSGIALSWLLVRYIPKTKPPVNSKRSILDRWLRQLKGSWGLVAVKTLSDKDQSEIAAMHAVFPEATHQLCFWHAGRAVKQRLAVLRRQPAPYDAEKAHEEFDFIDKAFVPVSQLDKLMPEEVRTIQFISHMFLIRIRDL